MRTFVIRDFRGGIVEVEADEVVFKPHHLIFTRDRAFVRAIHQSAVFEMWEKIEKGEKRHGA